MKFIMKFENGAERTCPPSPVPTEIFSITDREFGIKFWFALIDELPSGDLLYKEITADEARSVWGDNL